VPRYLVTDVARNGGLYLYDSTANRRERLLAGRFRGVTLGPAGWAYAVTGCRRHEPGIPTHVHRVHLDTRDHEDLGPVPYFACHDLRRHGGAFYLVASIGNLIVRLDDSLRETGRLAIVDDPADVCHVNCLAWSGERMLASIFTLSPGTRAQKRRSAAWMTEGKVLAVDFDRGGWEVLYEPLAQPHSLNWHGERLHLVESHTSRLLRLDLGTGRREETAQLSGFIRGLGFAGDEAVVGVTQMFAEERQTSRSVPWVTRFLDRWRPFEGLLVLDAATGRARQRHPWPGAEVYDIVPVEP